jgi:hypothetical protein
MVGMISYVFYNNYNVSIYLSAPLEINSILPFSSKDFKNKKKYHESITKHVMKEYNPYINSTDEAFSILLALAFENKMTSEKVEV